MEKIKVCIITIHKIFNYGSVLQAYALQNYCQKLGYSVDIIDYNFPNEWHQNHISASSLVNTENRFIKYLYGYSLFNQHSSIKKFVRNFLHLTNRQYSSPSELYENPPLGDIFVTGSDQLWNPNYCCGDPSFFLDFVSNGKKRIAYAASFGTSVLDEKFQQKITPYLLKYSALGVRENSGVNIIKNIFNENKAKVVLDPTLLLNKEEWNTIATPKRLITEKYILCYFLNYSFDAFPYVDQLADYIQKITGYKLVKVARPPRRLFERNTYHPVGASPEDFLALVRDAELVLTTSFHGTAFAVNYERPLFSIVSDRNASDSRQVSLLHNLGLDSRVLAMNDEFPKIEDLSCNYDKAKKELDRLRHESVSFLKQSLQDEV